MKVQSINPSTGKLIKEFTSSTPLEVKQTVIRARAAQAQWQNTTISQRKKLFEKFQKAVISQTQKIIKIAKDETGKMGPDIEAEIHDPSISTDYFFKEFEKVSSRIFNDLDPQVFPESTARVDYFPHGVVGLILPWNFPFLQLTCYVVPALITGNAVLVKPSEYSTLMALKVKELFDVTGFPKDLIQLVIGDEAVGKILVKSDLDKIFMVGSAEAGEDIIRNAKIKPVQVELGGNSAAVVLDDADLNLAVHGIVWGATYTAGQDCVGVKRVYVTKKISEKFIARAVDQVKQLKPGRDYGPVIRNSAREVILTRVRDAVRQGAQQLIGGKKFPGYNKETENGYWVSPAVVLNPPENCDLVAKETFGNVLPIIVIKDINEAISRVNNTGYGLSNIIFTKDYKKANMFASQSQTGIVFINEVIMNLPGVDYWGGWKNSGLPNTESKIQQCLKKKLIFENHSGKPRPFWYPYPESK